MARVQYRLEQNTHACTQDPARSRMQRPATTLERAQNREFALVVPGKMAILSISADSAVFFSRSKERPARRDLHAY